MVIFSFLFTFFYDVSKVGTIDSLKNGLVRSFKIHLPSYVLQTLSGQVGGRPLRPNLEVTSFIPNLLPNV